jgi:hypothetical protein
LYFEQLKRIIHEMYVIILLVSLISFKNLQLQCIVHYVHVCHVD